MINVNPFDEFCMSLFLLGFIKTESNIRRVQWQKDSDYIVHVYKERSGTLANFAKGTVTIPRTNLAGLLKGIIELGI